MRYIVLIYRDSDQGRFVDRFENAFPPRSIAPTQAAASARRLHAWVAARITSLARASRLEISPLRSIGGRSLFRWIAAPVLGVPSVYSSYSTMLGFWHGLGVSPSVWLQILAVVAGVASGLAVIARLRA